MATTNQEYAIFPMEYLNITQGINSGSHVGSFAIDIAGRDSAIDNAFAPFTGTIKKIWANGNSVWLESNAPVRLADGTTDYLTVLMTHDNNVSDLYVGKVIPQGVNYYQEGTAGNATGNHIHLNVGRGKFTGTGWYQNKYGYWVINNEIRPYDALYLSETHIINSGGYPWQTIKGGDIVYPTPAQVADVFNRFALEQPSQPQVDFYIARDIRELYYDVLYNEVLPSDSEVIAAFEKYQPWSKPDLKVVIPYYTTRSSSVLYQDLAGDLLSRDDNSEFTKVNDLYIKTK